MEKTERIRILKERFYEDIKSACDLNSLNNIRVLYLGKKSEIQDLGNLMKDLSIEEKKEFGKILNDLRYEIESNIDELKIKLEEKELNEKLNKESIDVTLTSTNINLGSIHPLTRIINEVEEIFVSMGYDVVDGPEVESDLYNFELLNLPKEHPARDTQDSFYINEEMLLRTQTSPVQARTMISNKEKGPIRIICPGKVYRKDDDDATHSHQFTQIEGLVIDENISMADLKGTLEILAKKLFGSNREIRFRPSFFPFTEPSIEVDVSCFNCEKQGCNICKHTGWIEILGAGMVHPNVLKNCGYDPKKYTGFAFGMGPERIAMLKYGINDIRNFYTNDSRFLKQFNRLDGDNNESK